MNEEEYRKLDATDLARLLRAREVDAADVARCALELSERLNPQLNAIVELYPERADAGWLRRFDGTRFAGVPFLRKDVGPYEAGKRTECASRLAEGYVAPETSGLLQRYEAAGFNSIGRSSSPEFGFNISTESLRFGRTRNPWAHDRSAGGSSGGAAAAVAAGIVPVAHANDGGGSIRIPASCCGVVGFKPGRGRVSCEPDFLHALSGLSCEHVVTRTVRDTAAVFDATCDSLWRPDARGSGDARAIAGFLGQEPGALAIGVMEHAWFGTRTDPEVRSALLRVVGVCEQLGHRVQHAAPPLGVEPAAFLEMNTRIWCANLAVWIDGVARAVKRPVGPATLEAATLACYEEGRRLRASELLEAHAVRDRVTMAAADCFRTTDILLCPTLPTLPWGLGDFDADVPGVSAAEWGARLFTASPFTPIANMTGQPAISLPLATDPAGIPIGMQFTAAVGREDILLRLAAQLERAMPWVQVSRVSGPA